MNSKKTNLIVSIANIITIIVTYLYISMSNHTYEFSGKLCLFLEYKLILMIILLFLIPGIINIICAIQNRENKKLFFWYLAFGLFDVVATFNTFIYSYIDVIWLVRVEFCVVPIILAIINLIRIKKNKPKKIQIISYILVIIFSVINMSGILDMNLYNMDLSYVYPFEFIGYNWEKIAVIMQLIYIHFQEDNVIEDQKRKKTNLIIHYILRGIITICLSITILIAFFIALITSNIQKKQAILIQENILTLSGAQDEEFLIPVVKNNKYGYINKKGKEVIPCQYDMISYFVKPSFPSFREYYIALVKQNNEYYVITKNNQKYHIDNPKYINRIIEDCKTASIIKNIVYDDEVMIFTAAFILAMEPKIHYHIPGEEKDYTKKYIELQKNGSMYYYNSGEYNMTINPDNDTVEGYTKATVTIEKEYGEKSTSVEYLPLIIYQNGSSAAINTLSDGYIEYISSDRKYNGWYDKNGNKTSISREYVIDDIINNKLIVSNAKDMYKKNIYDLDTGKKLIDSSMVVIKNDCFIIENNNKVKLYDKDVNAISKEYDRICK